jgi:3',5'-cyclic AMP phosphodiesterase CpdA
LDYTGRKPSSWFVGQYLTLKNVDQVEVIDGEIFHTEGNKQLEVVFNEPIDPREGWFVVKSPLKTWGSVPVYLTVKTGESTVKRPSLKMSSKLKILQLADLHFSSFDGTCRDQYPEVADCKADKRTMKFIHKALDIEKPDLVVLTGDQIFGEDSFHSQSTLLKIVKPLIDRKIPYAMMFGNHDDEGNLNREQLAQFIQGLPYSLMERGTTDIEGVGNYVLQIPEKKPKLTIYIMDSHKYSPNPKVLPGYDWLKESQLDWIKEKHSKMPKAPLSMAFFHVPLPEYRNLEQGVVGNYKEGVTAPKYNTGARDILKSLGVSVVSVGHDHCNDYCLKDSKKLGSDVDGDIWLCYGGAVGEGGYGGYGGTTRRLRLFEIDSSKGQIKTWKILETTMEKFDEQILVKDGQPVNLLV